MRFLAFALAVASVVNATIDNSLLNEAQAVEEAKNAQFVPTAHGVIVPIADGHSVEVAVEGLMSFRVSVAYDGQPAYAIQNRMVDEHTTFADFKIVTSGTEVGISTSFGTALIDSASGSFLLQDANGKNLTSSPQLSSFTGPDPSVKGDTCAAIYTGTDASGGSRTPSHPQPITNADNNACCAACNSDADCTFWVLDPGGKLCYLLQNVPRRVSVSNRNSGGKTTGGPATVTFNHARQSSARFYGAGGSAGAGLIATQSSPYVANTQFTVPYFYSSEGFASLGVSTLDYTPNNINSYPAQWSQTSGTTGPQTTWTIQGVRADVYFWPAATPAAAIAGYWDLTGKPKVLPRYAFGFQACRWGWTDKNYIDSILTQFRSGNYPIDSWISDFEWFTNTPDYNLPGQGSSTFVDFSYNSVTFPSPTQQLTSYHDQYHVRFGGIRKPRLGNSDLITMANNNGWTIPSVARNLNYSIPAVRDWYAQQIAHFLPDGVDYWWNDEGETQYFTFHDWNVAQLQALTTYDAKKRFLTINRSFTPGMQRMGLVIWTGDISVSWGSLLQTAQYLLAWGMAGVSYLTCDIGGFNGGNTDAQLLVRWYQAGTFLGMFRVHSTLANTPHFPFLYDSTSASIMKTAMDLRYQLLPHIYSLAHAQYSVGAALIRPLLYEFPDDSNVWSLNTQWLVGRSILAAPVLSQDNTRSIYLPNAKWFEWNSALTHQGPTTLNLNNLAMTAVPVYVRAGSIITLAPTGLQYSDQLPGGPLHLVVYAGADTTFQLIEDDGTSLAYTSGAASDIRRTSFTWSESGRQLSWSVPAGSYTGPNIFTAAVATAYFTDGTSKTLSQQTLGSSGTFQF